MIVVSITIDDEWWSGGNPPEIVIDVMFCEGLKRFTLTFDPAVDHLKWGQVFFL